MNLRADRSRIVPRGFIRQHECSPYTQKLIEELRSARVSACGSKLLLSKTMEKKAPCQSSSTSFDLNSQGIHASDNVKELVSIIPKDCSIHSPPPTELQTLQNKLSLRDAEIEQLYAEKKELLGTIETLKKNSSRGNQHKESCGLSKEFLSFKKKTEEGLNKYKLMVKRLSEENKRLLDDNKKLQKKMADKENKEASVQTEKDLNSEIKTRNTQVQSARTNNGLDVTFTSLRNEPGFNECKYSRNAVISEKKSQDIPSGHKPLLDFHKVSAPSVKQTTFRQPLFESPADLAPVALLRPPSTSVSGDRSSDGDHKISELQNVLQRLNEQYQTARNNYNSCGSTQERQAIKQYLSSLCATMEKTSLELFNCKKKAGLF